MPRDRAVLQICGVYLPTAAVVQPCRGAECEAVQPPGVPAIARCAAHRGSRSAPMGVTASLQGCQGGRVLLRCSQALRERRQESAGEVSVKVRSVFECLMVGQPRLTAGVAAAPLLGVCHRRGVGWVGLDSLCSVCAVCECDARLSLRRPRRAGAVAVLGVGWRVGRCGIGDECSRG